MSQVKSEHVCAFCMLVIQIGYGNLTEDDTAKIKAHMRIAHSLPKYAISE